MANTDRPLRTWRGKAITLRTDSDEAYARALLHKLDSFLAQANTELSRVLDVPVRKVGATIVVFEAQDRYQRQARRNAPGLVNNGGYYDGSTRTVVTYRFNNSMQLFFHELVHAVMAEHFHDHHFSRYTRRNWPIWFDEGMSEYLGSYAVEGTGIRIPAQNKGKLAYLSNALRHRAFVPLRTLLSAPASRFSGASMNIYYAESWGLVDYLAHHVVHRSQVPLFFRKVRAGEDGLAAFQHCFGRDLAAFESTWLAHIRRSVRPPRQPVWLFGGQSIDDWTVHEGGSWKVTSGAIVGRGDKHYNYLIKSEVPMRDFSFELDMMLEKGTAGLILGNNYHGEYPYYYLVDVARDAVMLRRSYTATRIEPVKQAFADISIGHWVHLKVTVLEHAISVSVDGREVMVTRSDRDSYSLFGLYLYHAKARFKNVRLSRERREVPGWARSKTLVRPGGAGAPAASPGGPASPLRTYRPSPRAPAL
ncbi:MAG: DUF1080 domain-containing protein [Myxococcales bacterium]|nr:DUF1080 domain-containing protein [Myxococcales bacterium]